MPIIPDQWRWFGWPGHFCAASACHWHMTTVVGKVLVSSVGDYRPDGRKTKKSKMGWDEDHLYETIVTDEWQLCEFGCCACCTGSEIETHRYATQADAHYGHLAACRAWSEKTEVGDGTTDAGTD